MVEVPFLFCYEQGKLDGFSTYLLAKLGWLGIAVSRFHGGSMQSTCLVKSIFWYGKGARKDKNIHIFFRVIQPRDVMVIIWSSSSAKGFWVCVTGTTYYKILSLTPTQTVRALKLDLIRSHKLLSYNNCLMRSTDLSACHARPEGQADKFVRIWRVAPPQCIDS